MRQGRNNQEATVQPQGRVLVPHQGICTSSRCFADTETPTRWEKLTVNNSMLPISTKTQTGWNQEIDDAYSHLPHQQLIRRLSMSWSHPLWTITTKLLTNPSSLGQTVLRALDHRGSHKFFPTSLKTRLWDLTWYQGTEARFGFNFSKEFSRGGCHCWELRNWFSTLTL